MSNFQNNPLKLYIQDIYRAKKSPENKYIYEIFGLTFKNVMIHGVVTAVWKTCETAVNLELSDPTGTVQIYYNAKINDKKVSSATVQDLIKNLARITTSGDDNAPTISLLLDGIIKKSKNIINFKEGDYVCVVGDIFLDDFSDIRMISAFQCNTSSVERDIIWLEEVRYLYDKFYLWKKE